MISRLLFFIPTKLLLAFFFLSSVSASAQSNWRQIVSVEDVCQAYPEKMREMLNQFDLQYPGLEKVKAGAEEDKLVAACKALLQYYKNGNNADHLRRDPPEETTATVAEADTTLKDVFIVQNVRGKVPVGDDGHRDWYYKGPNNDREWAWLSNRHSQINQVLTAYFETGNPKYAQYIDLFLRDFIIKSMPYPEVKSRTSVWRGLEVSFRSKVWSRIFYGLLNSRYLTPATQLLMLSSLPDHAHYNRNFHGDNNWLTMEISALATVATNFPEYKQSEAWLAYSIDAMMESMKDQVYPDGVQTELTSHYHNVSLRNFELFKEICDRAEKPLPDFYNETLESMYGYIAHAIRPDGFRILNNDGDRGSDRPLVLAGAETYNQPEWKYIATNGNIGTKPKDGPSYFYPWAGHLISRSGYDSSAHWSFFDIGPWGSGHQHNDKLHLSVAAFGHDFLVDAGRFAYTGEVAQKFRPYARSSAGHNVVLIDGRGQANGPTHAQEPVADDHYQITDNFDYASGSFSEFNDTKGEAIHQRAVMYIRGEFWIVVDRISTDRPREIATLWHWHPDSEVNSQKQQVVAQRQSGYLTIMPIGDHSFSIDMVMGQEQPELQGWYSPEYNLYEPNIATIYRTQLQESSTMAWILFPSINNNPKVKATIVSQDAQQIVLDVNSEKGSWQLTVPYDNSNQARLHIN
ncbi:MAG: heparinase II/III family protein [Bacteroidota bacterium]